MTGGMSFSGRSATTGAAGGAEDVLVSFSSAESIDLPAVAHLNPFCLEIWSTPAKGRGVYATRDIPQGCVVEISPVLLIPKEQYKTGVNQSELKNYVYTWNWGPGRGGRNGDMALALGLGSIFNHSRRANVSYRVRSDNLTIEYTTTSDIRAGEELCIYYGNLRFEEEELEDDDDDDTNWEDKLARLDVFENS
ncbi:hypothetical protein Mapa_017282 [Marchantia paleacea]|nr:hypothetical protein Mapa_017282 [Marchantia paleacea]